MEWETVIGLEVHVQLATNSKIFSGSSTSYGAHPNTQASAIDLGLPGVLPVLNREAVTMAIKLGLGIEADIAPISTFERKNYFYPDLPKGYQISQFDTPIVSNGHMDIILEDGTNKRICITRAHLEEDAGKSLHEDFHGLSGIDLNRAGTPLLEIVSEPVLRSATEAVIYLKALHTLVRYLEICDGNMQEGSFRCDANVSIRPKGEKEFGTRTETKNINSFRFVERAINYEVERQIALLESGGNIIQETRLYNAETNQTKSMREKVEANDYRYFPDPDLLPVQITDDMIHSIRETMPELPNQKSTRFQSDYDLSAYDAVNLVSHKPMADYFEKCVSMTAATPKLVANWMLGELSAALNKHQLDIINSPISAEQLALLLDRIEDKTISGKIAKTVFEAMWADEGTADEIIKSKNLKQMTDTTKIETLINDVIKANPTQLADYLNGKEQLFGYFVGQVMKASRGKANPKQTNDILKTVLEKFKTQDKK